MSEATEIGERVTQLEHDMAGVQYLATKADREVSDVSATLRGQIGVLNAIGDTQREHGLTLARHTKMLDQHGKRLDRLERKVDNGFATIDENFTEVERQFRLLRSGQERITELLTRRQDGPEET